MEDTNNFDNLFWELIAYFQWNDIKYLPYEEYNNEIDSKLTNFPHSEHILNALYDFIISKADRLYTLLDLHHMNIDRDNANAILQEIVSRGKSSYDGATSNLIQDIYKSGDYTIPGGLCHALMTPDTEKMYDININYDDLDETWDDYEY